MCLATSGLEVSSIGKSVIFKLNMESNRKFRIPFFVSGLIVNMYTTAVKTKTSTGKLSHVCYLLREPIEKKEKLKQEQPKKANCI
ncbi:MAG: hypothetical protein H7A23_15725 [Leptospiraceae bacterium]|nr:hypothetical protein [Leptospiraceae bacterium]